MQTANLLATASNGHRVHVWAGADPQLCYFDLHFRVHDRRACMSGPEFAQVRSMQLLGSHSLLIGISQCYFGHQYRACHRCSVIAMDAKQTWDRKILKRDTNAILPGLCCLHCAASPHHPSASTAPVEEVAQAARLLRHWVHRVSVANP